MSVKIRVSYESPEELQDILKRLAPMVQKCKASKGQKGRYKKAYIVLKEQSNSGRTPGKQ